MQSFDVGRHGPCGFNGHDVITQSREPGGIPPRAGASIEDPDRRLWQLWQNPRMDFHKRTALVPIDQRVGLFRVAFRAADQRFRQFNHSARSPPRAGVGRSQAGVVSDSPITGARWRMGP